MHARAALVVLALLTASVPAGAVTLDDVRRSLAAFHGDAALRVRIDTTSRRGDGKVTKEETSAFSIAEDDGTSIRLVHDKKELRRQASAKKSGGRPEQSIGATEVFELMNYGPPLLRLLDGATLTKTSNTVLDGAPVTLFEVQPVREKDDDGDKWIKAYADTLLLWVGPGGVPVAAERTMKIKARFVVVPVEFDKKEKYRFAHLGERLLVGARSIESSSSGLGRSEKSFSTAKVVILR